ncbi:MAG: type II toxin-antitoxin system PemK/MazF family toxin [Dehalococcoidales bacterium]|nr:type II toxin-antitoxin system PemK/MazF family toxin [Dehalococcoidales bacterium]
MTEYSRGDVILVGFIFTDETGVKRRPALIISSDSYHAGRGEAIIAAITSRTDRVLTGDHPISDWRSAGLVLPSVATGIIRTIKTNMVDRKLGCMSRPDMEAIDSKLPLALDLS